MLQPLDRMPNGVGMVKGRPRFSKRRGESSIATDESEIDEPRARVGKTFRTRLGPRLLIGPCPRAIDDEIDPFSRRAIDRDVRVEFEKAIGNQLCHGCCNSPDAIGQPAKTGANAAICGRMVQKLRIE